MNAITIDIISNDDLRVHRLRSAEHVTPMTTPVVSSLDSLLVDRNRRPMQNRQQSTEQKNIIPSSSVSCQTSVKHPCKSSMSSCSHIPKHSTKTMDGHKKCRTTSGQRHTSEKQCLDVSDSTVVKNLIKQKCGSRNLYLQNHPDHLLASSNRINRFPSIVNSTTVTPSSVPSNPSTSLELPLNKESGQSTLHQQQGLLWHRTVSKSKYNSLDDSDYDYRKKTNSMSNLLSSMEQMLSMSDSQIPSLLEVELKELQLQQRRPLEGTRICHTTTTSSIHSAPNHCQSFDSSNIQTSCSLDIIDGKPSCLQLTPTGMAIMTPIEWLEEGHCCRTAGASGNSSVATNFTR